MSTLARWWRHRRHAKICTCQVIGYLWYADGKVWALSPLDVEVVTSER